MRPRLGSGLAVLGCVVFAGGAIADPLTFAQDTYSSFAGARAIVTADFNRDGWPDIAQANTGRNTVTVLLNRLLTVRPGAAGNDNTILQQTYTPF